MINGETSLLARSAAGASVPSTIATSLPRSCTTRA